MHTIIDLLALIGFGAVCAFLGNLYGANRQHLVESRENDRLYSLMQQARNQQVLVPESARLTEKLAAWYTSPEACYSYEQFSRGLRAEMPEYFYESESE